MGKKHFSAFATTIICAGALACGYSPILHHVKAEDLKENNEAKSQDGTAASIDSSGSTGGPSGGDSSAVTPNGNSNPSTVDPTSGASDTTTQNPATNPNENPINTNPVPSESPTPSPSPSPATCDVELKNSGVCLDLSWDTKPTDEEEGAFTLHFWDKTDGTIEGPYMNPPHSLKVILWMPDMGHGSSPVKTKQSTDENGSAITGVYNVTRVTFVMPGEWEIRIQLKKDGKVVDEAILPYTY